MQADLLLTASLNLSEIPPLFWVASFVGILSAASLGFFTGVYYSRSEEARSLDKAKKKFQKLFDLTALRLKKANQACTQLEKYSQDNFNEKEEAVLQQLQSSISDKILKCVSPKVPQEEPEEIKSEVQPISWKTDSVDSITSIPTVELLEKNLNQMLDYSRLTGTSCSTLLCRIDKIDKLEKRIGKDTVNHFRKKLSSLLIRSLTELDIVCQLDRATFMILIPDRTDDESLSLVDQVIQAVRNYHFRSPETDQEILVTASFGFTPCLSQDSYDTIIGRGQNAVTKSERRGRNQLHIHDGMNSVHSLNN